ncbi:pentapeptide repeat-containing protein [Edaphobacter sp. 12200R-103]|uniref:pentapeptide repeat-containing protein n=1 Tax=Edaphobacter sp. 12200R-103 TaxID=2703788 RepID=UPI00192ECB3A|nr:pentapeptide repeat-containing protein [Edaphobacter sp. 12200R-103]
MEENFDYKFFLRVAAKDKKFQNVSFKYTIFDSCYFRKCIFESCDFTGCRFLATNFNGATFLDCKFDYATFEKTLIADDVLDVNCPAGENIRAKFARTLRINYQQLGEARSANKAMGVELDATKTHLYKAWRSQERYFRAKYRGLTRLQFFFSWLSFNILDVLWGNGESILKLVRSILIFLVILALVDTFKFRDPGLVRSYWRALVEAPQTFLGTRVPPNFSHSALTLILSVRLIMFGALTSLIIKRYGRR